MALSTKLTQIKTGINTIKNERAKTESDANTALDTVIAAL